MAAGLSLLDRLAGSRPARRAADAGLVRYAHQRAAALDRLDAAAEQRRTLLRLVRRAASTRFGRDHGFQAIRSVREYQRRVPLRGYEQIWSEYWSAPFPRLAGVTWPEPIPYYALSSGTTTGATKYIPVSREMLASNKKAAFTTMALFRHTHPDAGILTGRVFFLGGSTDLRELEDGSFAGDLSGIAAKEAGRLLRPYTYPPPEVGLIADWEQKVRVMAEQSARLPVTMISGVPAWVLVLFDRLKQATGKDRVEEIWPELRLVVHGGTKFEPYRPVFRRELGPGVRFIETYPCSEGFVATEDPRYDLLRLVPDHGIFFEFVPAEELDKAEPARHTLADVVTGVQYAVVLTTCAGVWSYTVGDTVAFERRDPPLLRFTGRTKYYLSAFGEHLISEEVEKAVAAACEAGGAEAVDFHVGPVFPDQPDTPGRHRYFVEFRRPPADLGEFAARLDRELCALNEDYDAHRKGDLSMLAPEVVAVPAGGFAEWMRSRGKLGGQNKVPRMDNDGTITKQIQDWLSARG